MKWTDILKPGFRYNDIIGIGILQQITGIIIYFYASIFKQVERCLFTGILLSSVTVIPFISMYLIDRVGRRP